MKAPVTLAMETEVCAALDRVAAGQLRSRSWLANEILRSALVAEGALPPSPQQPPPSREREAA
jgi:predicted transcriptional regulator